MKKMEPSAESVASAVVPTKLLGTKRLPMARKGLGRKGSKTQLLSNHFPVTALKTPGFFYKYHVTISYDGKSVPPKAIGRKLFAQVVKLDGEQFAYDGDKILFTTTSLRKKDLDLDVNLPLEEPSPERAQHPARFKTYKVAIKFDTKIPMDSIFNVLSGKESEHFQEAMRVLDIILRQQQAANRDFILVRQSYFHHDVEKNISIGGGIDGCKGYHSSFRHINNGLALNIDASTTMIISSTEVLEFLLQNQDVQNPLRINWDKAKRTLRNLRIISSSSKMEHKITGLSDKICREQTFSMKQNNRDELLELTVYQYFTEHREMNVEDSANFPCISVGRSRNPVFIPIQFCRLVPLQRYTRSLTKTQRTTFVERSRQTPEKKMTILTDELRRNNYQENALLSSAKISVDDNFTKVVGRVLEAPKLSVGNGSVLTPTKGSWSFNGQKLFKPKTIKRWIIANFGAACDLDLLSCRLINCASEIGIELAEPCAILEENHRYRRAPAATRVEKMFEMMQQSCGSRPEFILCVLPERKSSDLYGPWKKKSLSVAGIVTQCIAPVGNRFANQYFINVLLKINIKMGGINSILQDEFKGLIPFVSKVPTVIIGMDVSHGSPGRDVPSIAAVVSSREWPQISRYSAVVRTQSPRTEMIEALCKKVSDTKDEGIFREVLEDFLGSCGSKPEHIIIFRDGVSESQFTQVLNNEFEQIIEACKLFDGSWAPKFCVIVAQKNNHTKFFKLSCPTTDDPGKKPTKGIVVGDGNRRPGKEPAKGIVIGDRNRRPGKKPTKGIVIGDGNRRPGKEPAKGTGGNDPKSNVTNVDPGTGENSPKFNVTNVDPGTVIDNGVCHPRNNDFYLCAHRGTVGTSRPIHYHVLHDEIGFSADELQELVHSLSYTCQRSTTAVSLVAPIWYADLAAAQMSEILISEEVPQLPALHQNLKNSMFFC